MTESGVRLELECELVADRVPAPLRLRLRLQAGATVGDAVQAAFEHWGEVPPDPAQLRAGVWGVEARPSQPLRNDDRVELYRPLPKDPRLARRERVARRPGSR